MTAVFERFTERSIKCVMIAQAQAKALGHGEVRGTVSGAFFSALPTALMSRA